MKRTWSRVVPANSVTEDIVFTILCIILIAIIAVLVAGILYVYIMWPLGIWWASNTIFHTTIPLNFTTWVATWVGIACIQIGLGKL